jgi:hypothetical protein
MVVNERLRENPALQRWPQSEREWVHYQNELAKWVLKVAKLGDGSLVTSADATISGLDEMPGTLPDSDSLNTITAFNKGSAQSAAPITAADVGSDTTVTIAAHNILYDGNTVAYNSGTITGLAFATTYYIYVDDATKAGGAVTYIASTTATDMVASKARYYVGEVTTPADGAGGTSGGGGGGAGSGPSNGGEWP